MIEQKTFRRVASKDIEVAKLRQHPRHIDVALSESQANVMTNSILASGVRDRLLVSPAADGEYEVLAGCQRLKSALLAGMKTVPCDVIETDDPVSVMLEDNIIGRSRTKSAIALQVFLYNEKALMNRDIDAGKECRLSNLRKGKESPKRIESASGNIGVFAQKLADRYGFDEHYLLDLCEIRARCDDTEKGREAWNKVVAAIMHGEVGIPQAKAGFGGHTSTVGRKRADTNYGDLVPKAATTMMNAWKHWDLVDDQKRDSFLDRFSKALEVIPDDGIIAIGQAIHTWPASRVEMLMRQISTLIKK